MVSNPCAKPVLLVVYGRQATNTWIYYTNRSPLSTIIWLNFATKLCQRQSPVADQKGHTLARRIHWKLRTADSGGFFIQVGLFVRVKAGKQVKRLPSTDNAQKSERISQYFAGFQGCHRGWIRAKEQVHFAA